MSKKSSTFAAALRKSTRSGYTIGAPENPLVFGESGGTEHLNEPVAAGEKAQSMCEVAERETR